MGGEPWKYSSPRQLTAAFVSHRLTRFAQVAVSSLP